MPPASRTLGDEAVTWFESHGGRLFDWQKLVIRGFLGVDESGKWTTAVDGLNVARQNGKGVVLMTIELFAMYELGYELVIHTAHEFATSQEHQRRCEEFILESPSLLTQVKSPGGFRHANGQESINLKNGNRIAFKARTGGSGRGWSADLLVWDEAMVIPDHVVSAQYSTTRASDAEFGRKTIMAGSAVDQEQHAYGINFATLRERGILETPGVSWFEWSAPFDHPNELTEEAAHDKANWHAANPSISEGLISEKTMADEVAALPRRPLAVELFGIGDWPRTDGLEDTVVDIQVWDKLKRDPRESRLEEPYCGAFDVSPERNGSIAVAGRNENGEFQVEIHDHRLGTGWMVKRILEMDERGLFESWVCDATGPASSLLLELEDAGLRVERVNATEHGQAYGRFLDMVRDGELVHLGSDELRDAVRGAKPRPIGDGSEAWGRKHSTVNIAPLVAATLALGAATGLGAGLQVF